MLMVDAMNVYKNNSCCRECNLFYRNRYTCIDHVTLGLDKLNKSGGLLIALAVIRSVQSIG